MSFETSDINEIKAIVSRWEPVRAETLKIESKWENGKLIYRLRVKTDA